MDAAPVPDPRASVNDKHLSGSWTACRQPGAGLLISLLVPRRGPPAGGVRLGGQDRVGAQGSGPRGRGPRAGAAQHAPWSDSLGPCDDSVLVRSANQPTPSIRVLSGIRSGPDPPDLLRRPPGGQSRRALPPWCAPPHGEPPSTGRAAHGRHRSGNCSIDTSTSSSASTTSGTSSVTASGDPSSRQPSRSSSPAATCVKASPACVARGVDTSSSSPSPAVDAASAPVATRSGHWSWPSTSPVICVRPSPTDSSCSRSPSV